jgi:porin
MFLSRLCRHGSTWQSILVGLVLTLAPAFLAGQTSDQSDHATPAQQESKSGYEDPAVMGGSKAVGAQLVQDDRGKKSLIDLFVPGSYYDLKRRLKQKIGIELNVDYSFLNQYASYSSTDRQAASGSLRFYGRWIPRGDERPFQRALVFRFENRHVVGSGITPRDLGFDAGSALSTPSFKAFGWGVTSLYWEHAFSSRRYALVFGQMDPGDFEDLHPLLNAWTDFMNDASFNNPTTALPQQGLGIVGHAFFSDHLYVAGGVNDANGSPSRIDFSSFFKAREHFKWAEVGWAPRMTLTGDGVHFTAWHADSRTEEEIPESWGVAFSAARKLHERWHPYVRAGYSPRSDKSPVLLSAMLTLGLGLDVRSDDRLGAAVTWGRPPQSEARDQFSFEAWYRLQLTPHIQLSPGAQWTLHPAMNFERNSVWVVSIARIRVVF